MTRDEITKLLEIITATYPHAVNKIKDPSAMATAWELALGEYEAKAVYKAARLHLATNKYFPSPADIQEKLARASLIYSSSAPALRAPKKPAFKLPDGMTEDAYLNSIIQLEIEMYGPGEDPTDKYFLPYEK